VLEVGMYYVASRVTANRMSVSVVSVVGWVQCLGLT